MINWCNVRNKLTTKTWFCVQCIGSRTTVGQKSPFCNLHRLATLWYWLCDLRQIINATLCGHNPNIVNHKQYNCFIVIITTLQRCQVITVSVILCLSVARSAYSHFVCSVYSQGAWWRTIGNAIWALHKTHIWTPPKAWTTVSSLFSMLIFSHPGCRGRCLNKSYKNCYCDPG